MNRLEASLQQGDHIIMGRKSLFGLRRRAPTALVSLLFLLSFTSALRADEPLRVGVFSYEPAIFRNAQGKMEGFYADLLREAAGREGWDLKFVYGSWAEGLERLERGEVDILTSVAHTEERAVWMDYGSEPLLTVWSEVYVPQASAIDSIFELQGKRIAVMARDYNAAEFRQHVAAFGIECSYIEVADFDAIFQAVTSGQADAGVINSTVGAGRAHHHSLKGTGIVFNPFNIYFAAAKGRRSKELAVLDGYLKTWKDDRNSIYYKGMAKWLRRSVEVRHVTPTAVWYVSIGLGVLFCGALGIAWAFRWQVARATAELRESEEKYRRLAENTEVILWEYDIPSDRWTYVAPQAERILGYGPEEWTDLQFWIENIHPEDKEWAPEYCNTFTAQGQSHEFEYRFLTKNGETRWLRDVVSVEMKDGKPALMRGFMIDITARKQAQEESEQLRDQLVQSHKMESVGRLAGGVAHDFNNMLGVILGHSELLIDELPPDHPLLAGLEEIKKAAERSADITHQLLAFARKQTIAPKVLDLNQTVESMLKMLRRLIGEDVNISWRPGESLRPVRVDPTQLNQILANLCVNARDAIAGVGQLTIETGNICFDAAYCAEHTDFAPGEYVMLVVSDDGCGMDAETLAKIFEPFFTTKGVGEGTGLGLATVYGIVKQNGGFISARSEPGKGATFNVYLPQDDSGTASTRSEDTAEPTGRGSETIVLVEDELSILKVTKIMLQQQGYTVLAATTPGEAIALVRAHGGAVDLLLTDVVMPEMNGRDLARNLMSISPGLKCLFMSGYTADVIAHHGVLEEGMHFIQKPFARQDMTMKVREALGGG
jgi:PAS domain S-box-containing protein